MSKSYNNVPALPVSPLNLFLRIVKLANFLSDLMSLERDKIKSDNPEIIETIQSSGKLDEDTEKSLVQIIESYKK